MQLTLQDAYDEALLRHAQERFRRAPKGMKRQREQELREVNRKILKRALRRKR